ncbi:peptide-methionine (R)-S-oxide reductase MsrB [Allosphingosinicella flava]|uniref:Peptide methionine sulfoxide reductase MsrB n=1 Tax=Allosphingosinicella flava TaxID=2771430 RepID=A0A7T2LMR2_9SPHN|nr:peptide-methionine (R)-S-oxide reductase MsrB [Sphingosinicella flava]QPQ55402.1 peptide-methionine (R)-S-oxide reductase MsrB [Sphingosinicella flava]
MTQSASGYDVTPLTPGVRDRLAADLSPDERQVILEHGTERPFCGTLLNNKSGGVYACRLCGLPLFKSGTKFESGTGWPSFTEPFDADHIREIEDRGYGMVRVEIRCARCDGHLGHVFPDGPPPTGLRYCLNSIAMEFYEDEADIPDRLGSE